MKPDDEFEQLALPPRELVAYCYRMTGSADEAEELVQETLMRAWRSRETFDGRAKLSTWLCTIAHRVAIDHVRKTLRNNPSWQPSAGFAARVALRAVQLPQNQIVAPRFWSLANVAAVVPLAALAAAGGYFIGAFVDVLRRATASGSPTSIKTTWVWVVLSYALAAWFVSRPHPVE